MTSSVYGGVLNAISPSDSVLDLGCGIFQHVAGVGQFIVGVDCFAAYADSTPPGAAFIHAVLPGCLDLFPDRSFDVVICLDVLEHLPADAAMEVAKRMRSIARELAIIATPSTDLEQEGWDAWGLGLNPAQAHISHTPGPVIESLGYVMTYPPAGSWVTSVGVYTCP